MGRLTKDPEIRYSQGDEPLAIARYSLAVNKRFKRQGEQGTRRASDAESGSAQRSADRDADFIPCVAFGKQGEFAERYFKKGQMISVVGRLQVRNWEDNEGKKRVTTEVVVEEQYTTAPTTKAADNSVGAFKNVSSESHRSASIAESKKDGQKDEEKTISQTVKEKKQAPVGFYPIDDNIEDDDLPF